MSKALNAPMGSNLVSDTTRAKVMAAAEELGYRPSWRAQMLARKRSQLIAVAYSAPLGGAMPGDVYTDIMNVLEEQLRKRDYSLTLVHTLKADEHLDRMLSDTRFDACISLGIINPAVLEVIRGCRMPAVLINSGADESWCRVGVDDEDGAAQAMKHLLGLGHRKIIYNAGRSVVPHPSARVRYATYRRCMTEAGLEPMDAFVGAPEVFVGAVMNLPVGERPTAVLDFEHWSAIAVMQELWRKGLAVPRDLSVVTFNDPQVAKAVIPPLTTMAHPAEEMARAAVEMLMARIENPEMEPETVTLKQKLVVRESTSASEPARGEKQ